jgi:hypothetical protein
MSDYDMDIHRTLVSSLVSQLAWSTAEVVAARGIGTLPRPEPIGGAEPDVVARGAGVLVIGEAKSNPRMSRTGFVDQLRVWLDSSRGSDVDVTLALAVPAGWRDAATHAAREAGWSDDDLTVLEVGIPNGPPAPNW